MAIIGLSKPPEQVVATEPRLGDTIAAAAAFASERPFRLFVFLRHTGCPFAEKTVRDLRDLSHADARVQVIFVGHGDAATTAAWLQSIGGRGNAAWIDDPSRQFYGSFGLGYSGALHFLGRHSLGAALALRRGGVRNRSASGTRWQKAGAFLVDRDGRLVWNLVPATADELPSAIAIRSKIDEAASSR